MSAIEALHIKHIREGMLYPFSAQFATYQNAVQTLSAAGVRTDGGVQASDLTARDFATRWANWFQSVGGTNWVESSEPPNECDLNGCIAQVPSYQQTLYTTVKGYAPTASLPVYGPSLTTLAADQQTGSLVNYLDTGNGHFYTLSQPPETTGICQVSDACSNGANTGSLIGNTYSLQTLVQDVGIVSGSKPVYNTETGYCTTVTAGNTVVDDVPRDVQAEYWPRYLLHAFGDVGIPRTYIYEIADDGLSPPSFDQCGLIDNTATPKPAFLVLQTMLNALYDSSSPAPVPLAYQLSAPNNVNGTPPEAMAFSKSDGSYVVFVWNPVSVYYQQSGNGSATSHELTVAPISGTLRLGRTFSSAKVTTFTASTGANSVQSVSPSSPIALTITPMITMITLRP